MPVLYERDPTTGTFVPVLGGVSQEQADARYATQTTPSLSGSVSVSYPTDDGHAANRYYVDNRFVGVSMLWAGNSPPSGWLRCDGSNVSRTTYAALYKVLGTTYGTGDGSTTFGLPNTNSRVVAGHYSGDASYSTYHVAGGAGPTCALDKSLVPNSTGWFEMHNSSAGTQIHGVSGWGVSINNGNAYRNGYQNPNNPSLGTCNFNLGFGSVGTHENRMPYIVLMYIIKY